MKKTKIIFILLIFLALINITNISTAMTHYQMVGTSTGLVTANALNVRQGPGTSFKSISLVYKNEYVRVFAKIGDWYVIQTNSDYIGTVSSKYIKLIYPSNTTNGTSKAETSTNTTLTADEQEVFNLINEKRVANGLSKLIIDEEVQKVARIKAQDMVSNNYFSHTSPIYGSPFDMLKSFKVSYKAARRKYCGKFIEYWGCECLDEFRRA